MNIKEGYRKWSITLLGMALATVLLITKYIDQDTWSSLLKVILPSFLGANLMTKWLNGRVKQE